MNNCAFDTLEKTTIFFRGEIELRDNRITDLEVKLKIATEALEFYLEAVRPMTDFDSIIEDGGAKARDALQKIKG